MLKPWDAYLIYTAIKLHFDSESYDAVRYNYKTSVKEKSFFARKDKYFFAKLAKRYPEKQTLINYYIANLFITRTERSGWVNLWTLRVRMYMQHGSRFMTHCPMSTIRTFKNFQITVQNISYDLINYFRRG